MLGVVGTVGRVLAGPRAAFCPKKASRGAEPVSLCLAVSTFVPRFVPLTLFFLYFSLSLALVISFCLCLSRPVCPLCPPASCPLCLNSGAGRASDPSSSSGSRRFLPGQRWARLMILLIFTVSTGCQQATPAALPRCPQSQSACRPCASPRATQCPPGPFCSAVKLEGRCGLHFLQDLYLVELVSELPGTGVCGSAWLVLTVLGRPSSLPRWLSLLPLIGTA